MVRVAIDAMGGDYAPGEIVTGAVAALNGINDLGIILVGRHSEIETHLKSLNYPVERLEMIHTDEVIAADDDPGKAVRKKKKCLHGQSITNGPG